MVNRSLIGQISKSCYWIIKRTVNLPMRRVKYFQKFSIQEQGLYLLNSFHSGAIELLFVTITNFLMQETGFKSF